LCNRSQPPPAIALPFSQKPLFIQLVMDLCPALHGAQSGVSYRARGAFQVNVAKKRQALFRSKSVAFFPKLGFLTVFFAQGSPRFPSQFCMISIVINELAISC